MYPDDLQFWPMSSKLEKLEMDEKKIEFQNTLRTLFTRKGMSYIGKLIAEELRGVAELITEDSEAKRKMLSAAELVEDTMRDVSDNYGL